MLGEALGSARTAFAFACTDMPLFFAAAVKVPFLEGAILIGGFLAAMSNRRWGGFHNWRGDWLRYRFRRRLGDGRFDHWFWNGRRWLGNRLRLDWSGRRFRRLYGRRSGVYGRLRLNGSRSWLGDLFSAPLFGARI